MLEGPAGWEISPHLSQVTEDAYQLYGMSLIGLAPKVLSKRNRTGADGDESSPMLAFLPGLVMVMICISFPFEHIVAATNGQLLRAVTFTPPRFPPQLGAGIVVE